jgi:hypothetical protein
LSLGRYVPGRFVAAALRPEMLVYVYSLVSFSEDYLLPFPQNPFNALWPQVFRLYVSFYEDDWLVFFEPSKMSGQSGLYHLSYPIF